MHACNPKAYTIPGGDAMPAELVTQRPPPPLLLAPIGGKTVELDCDGGRVSSDAGLILLHAPDEQLGVTRDLAAVLRDPRDPRRVDFTLHDLLKQRVLHMAAGYADANDANTLRHDPIFQVRLDRLPARGPPVASPPTLSRCENRVSRTALSRLARVFVEQCIASYARPPQRIVLAFDATEDPAHGEPEHSRDDGSYGGDCCLPLHVDEGRSGRLITTIFQAKRCRAAPRLGVLQRLRKGLRQAWPDTLLRVRGASHFAYPEVLPWMEAPANRHDVTGLTSNRVLQQLAHEVVAQANRASARDGGKGTRCHSTRDQAGTWSRPRRVVLKVEVAAQGVNTRFGVTDLAQARAQGLDRQRYCARGHAENASKDHQRSVQSERTACHRFEANPCRLFLHAAASGLRDPLRREVCKGTPWACATMETLQLRWLKLGARVQACTDRLTIALPSSCPVAPVLRRRLPLVACVRLTSQAR